MIDTATGSHTDVTVVLLGHDQADHRARALHYYAGQGVACLALEPAGQLGELLDQVKTPFVCLALDADFVLADALGKAAAYLAAQPQVKGVQGHALAYAAGNCKLSYHKLGAFAAPEAAGDALARVRRYGHSGQQAWRAVLRVATLQNALAGLPQALDAAGWRVALGYAILLQGEIGSLEQTDVVCELRSNDLGAAAREERLTQTVRSLRQWDEAAGVCAGEDGFVVLNRFVRSSYDQGEAPLLFSSDWASVIDDPEQTFEPRQYVELPYYNGKLFQRLSEIEFLCHAWATGERHLHALEGAWVRQHDLLQVHPNDTNDSLQQRYLQALGLGLFNQDVCQRLVPLLTGAKDTHHVREMQDWLVRLRSVPAPDARALLETTPSGKVLAAIAAATPAEADRARAQRFLARHPAAQIAFVVLDLENDDQALQATFDSLLASGLRNFKLVVLKGGKPPAITTARDTLHFIQVNEGNWATHLNQVVKQLSSEWLLLLDAGDVLLAGGLLRLAVELAQAPGCQAIAADEVQRDSEGRLLDVTRPGSDLDLLRSQPGLMSRHWLVRRQAVVDLGGYSESYRHALEYDLLLRLVQQQGVGCLAHMDDYLVIGQQPEQALTDEAAKVLNRHLTELGYRAQISDQGSAGLTVDFRHTATPLVSILLAGEGDTAQLQVSLTGIFQRTRYPRFEVVVALPGHDSAGQAAIAQTFGTRVRLIAGEAHASREQLLALAAGQARGDYLVLLSERCHVITPAWIESLLNEAQRPEVGIVGASLWGRGEVLLHAGYELLDGGQVNAPWAGASAARSAAARWPLSVRDCPAVSGDCLMIGRETFEQCGGLPTTGAADLALCLAVRSNGLMVVWTPRARLMGNELVVPAGQAVQALAEQWPGAFQGVARLDGKSAAGAPQWLAQLG